MGKSRLMDKRSGFTILEVLVALFVIGSATTVFIGLYTSSLALARSSTHYAVASQLAEEFLAEMRSNPSQFVWPNYSDKPIGELHDVVLVKDESPIRLVDLPTAMPNLKSEYDRENRLYRNFAWTAFSRIHGETANFVEVLIVVTWEHEGKLHRFYLTSALPRSIGEGMGR